MTYTVLSSHIRPRKENSCAALKWDDFRKVGLLLIGRLKSCFLIICKKKAPTSNSRCNFFTIFLYNTQFEQNWVFSQADFIYSVVTATTEYIFWWNLSKVFMVQLSNFIWVQKGTMLQRGIQKPGCSQTFQNEEMRGRQGGGGGL